MIQGDQNNHLQLVHEERLHWLVKPSRTDRLLNRLRRKKVDQQSETDIAATGAYRFISEKYQLGDEVMFVPDNSLEYLLLNSSSLTVDVENLDPRPTNAASILARHLLEGTRPQDISGGEGDVTDMRINIHCVAAFYWSCPKINSASNDELRSRFPPRTEQVVSYSHNTVGTQSCSTKIDPDGGIVSREICCYSKGNDRNLFIHATKDIVYYESQLVPECTQRDPVWTHELPASMRPDGVQSTPLWPVGMYRWEWRKYEDGADSVLVWKATRT